MITRYGSVHSLGEEGSSVEEYGDVEEKEGLVPMEGVLSVEKREERALSASKWRIIALLATLFVAVGTVWRTSVTRQNAVGSVEVEVWMQNPLNAEIKDEELDDQMVVDCVPEEELKFVPVQLQLLGGFIRYGIPPGGTVLADRGQFSSLKGGSYDYLATYQDMIDGYDSMLSACTDIANGVKESDPSCPDLTTFVDDRNQVFIIEEDLLFNTTQGSEPSAGVACIESCVQDRFFAYSETVGEEPQYTTCNDPVSAAMVYGVPVIKSCISSTYDCTEGGIHSCPFTQCFDCITDCLMAEYP